MKYWKFIVFFVCVTVVTLSWNHGTLDRSATSSVKHTAFNAEPGSHVDSELDQLKVEMEVIRGALNEERASVNELRERLRKADELAHDASSHAEALEARLELSMQQARSRRTRLATLQKRLEEVSNSANRASNCHFTSKPLTYAVYRILYGDEFLQESVESVLPLVDRIFIFYTNRTWNDVNSSEFGGKRYELKFPFDETGRVLDELRESDKLKGKLIIEYFHSTNNSNQVTNLVNEKVLKEGKYAVPELLLFVEWDHVWRPDQLWKAVEEMRNLPEGVLHASSRVFECYRTPRYFAKERAWRYGSVFWNMSRLPEGKMPQTGMHANAEGMWFLQAHMHNMGLCMRPELMFQKFLIALAFSEAIGDSPPDEAWLEDAWTRFDPYTQNHGLEMAFGYRNDMPFAYEYNYYELPAPIQQRLDTTPHWNEAESQFSEPDRQKAEDAILHNPKMSRFLSEASESFVKAVIRYFDLHGRIMDHLEKESSQRKSKKQENGDGENRGDPYRTRFLIFRHWPEAGLGNRLQALASAFLLAMLTDRALLVDWPAAEPMLHFNGEETVGMVALAELFESPGFDWTFNANREAQLAHLTHSNVSYEGYLGYRGTEDLFQCEDYNVALVDYDVLHIRADQFFALLIAVNPLYRPQLMDWFGGDALEMATPLLRVLFHPAADVQQRIDDFAIAHKFENASFVLGLQIRKVGASKLSDAQEELFWQCAEETTRSRALQFQQRKQQRLNTQKINRLAHNSADIVWVLATDNVKTRELAKRRYGSRVVFYDAPLSRANKEGLKNAVVDLWLLSKADILMVSAASTFGRIPVGLIGPTSLPIFVNRNNECQERVTAQPCVFKLKYATCVSDHDKLALPTALTDALEIDCDQT